MSKLTANGTAFERICFEATPRADQPKAEAQKFGAHHAPKKTKAEFLLNPVFKFEIPADISQPYRRVRSVAVVVFPKIECVHQRSEGCSLSKFTRPTTRGVQKASRRRVL
jgi:hypothetical protein